MLVEEVERDVAETSAAEEGMDGRIEEKEGGGGGGGGGCTEHLTTDFGDTLELTIMETVKGESRRQRERKRRSTRREINDGGTKRDTLFL